MGNHRMMHVLNVIIQGKWNRITKQLRMLDYMTEQTCHWKGCSSIIQVDTSMEDKLNFISVVGWCDVHQAAFAIATEMEQKFCKDNKIDWPFGSLSSKKYKKEIHKIHTAAGKQAEKEAAEIKCDCDCGCTKSNDRANEQCGDCDDGTHWDENHNVYVNYDEMEAGR